MTKGFLLRASCPRPATWGRSPVAHGVLAHSLPYTQPVLWSAVRLLLLLPALWLLAMAVAPSVQAANVFLPLLQSGEIVAGGGSDLTCNMSETELGLAAILASHPQQARERMVCDPILARVARERAADMAARGYFDHVNPDGFGPNYLVRQAGYALPDMYGDDPRINMVESIAGGFGLNGGGDAWAVWENSDAHRTHLLGLNWFTAGQERFGIGHVQVEGSPFTNYWVFISAHPPQ